MFAILLALVAAIDRIWRARICSAWSSRPSCACTSSTRYCAERSS